MNPVRRAGSMTLPDGRMITWSVADGRRGRRWRSATRAEPGRLDEALLLELEPDGRLAKLELTTAAGLLTLHPDGTALHGNAVTHGGVEHLRFDWEERSLLVVRGSPFTAAANAARVLRGGVGEGLVPALVVRPDFSVVPGEMLVQRRGPSSVWTSMYGHDRELELDADGIPVELAAGGAWPLELD